MINNAIIKVAESLIGIEEIRGNKGFKDNARVKKLYGMHPQELFEVVGFKYGYAWCVLSCELIWKLAYLQFNPSILGELDKLFSASVVETKANFGKSDRWLVDKKPEVGSIAIWLKYDKNGKKTGYGHAAILKYFTDKKIATVDGNTNDKGGREGYIQAERIRNLDFSIRPEELCLDSFIHPIQA